MIGITWQSVKAFVDAKSGTNVRTGSFFINPKDGILSAKLVDANGKDLNMSVPITSGQTMALRALVRRFDRERKPDTIDGAAMAINWNDGTATVELFYTKDFNKHVHTERHTFAGSR